MFPFGSLEERVICMYFGTSLSNRLNIDDGVDKRWTQHYSH